MEESPHCRVHLAAALLVLDLLVDLDRLLGASRRTIHILVLHHVRPPIDWWNDTWRRWSLFPCLWAWTKLDWGSCWGLHTRRCWSARCLQLTRKYPPLTSAWRESVQNVLWFGFDSSAWHRIIYSAHIRSQCDFISDFSFMLSNAVWSS